MYWVNQPFIGSQYPFYSSANFGGGVLGSKDLNSDLHACVAGTLPQGRRPSPPTIHQILSYSSSSLLLFSSSPMSS